MRKLPSPRRQPNMVRIPHKKPSGFRATSQQQSDAGIYDVQGGDRLKKVLLWVVVFAIVALIVTVIVDVIVGRPIL